MSFSIHRAFARTVLSTALLCAAAQAGAQPLKLLGATLDLPFDFKVRDSNEFASSGHRASRSVQAFEVEVTSGPHAGKVLLVQARYYAPERMPPETMTRVVREAAKTQGEKPGVRATRTLQVDGFDFHYMDGPVESTENRPQRMIVTGAVNGAIYSLSVFAPDADVLATGVGEQLQAPKLDYASLLQARARFDSEAKTAAADRALESPMGRLMLAGGIQARLVGSGVRRDAEGHPTYRSREFSLFKAGFWTLQSVVVSVGCGNDDANEYAKFVRMTDEVAETDEDERYVNPSLPEPARLAGLAGETASASGPTVSGTWRRSSVTRLAARDSGRMYLTQVERFNGSPIENALTKQLADASPTCHVDLPLGPPPPKQQGASAVGESVARLDD